MEEWFNRFLDMVENLKNNPEIVVTNFSIFDPITDLDIDRVEGIAGSKLDPTIKDFFTLSNGLQLKWIHKKNPQYDANSHQPTDSGFDWLQPLEWYGVEDGCINILPLQVSLLDQEWGEIVWSYEDEGQRIEFANQEYDLLLLLQNVKPMDIFSKSSSMAFLLSKSSGNPQILLAQDHFADIESSIVTNFISYLEFLLHHYGMVEKRTDIFSEYGGHNNPLVLMGKEYWEEQDRPHIDGLYS